MATQMPNWRSLSRGEVLLTMSFAAVGTISCFMILAWCDAQVEPIQEAIAQHHFKGASGVERQPNGTYLLEDRLANRQVVDIRKISSMGVFSAQADGTRSWYSSGGGLTIHNMHYQLRRSSGIWTVEEAKVTLIGCGARVRMSPESRARHHPDKNEH